MADIGIDEAKKNAVINPASRIVLGNLTFPKGETINSVKENIPNLNKFETKCLAIQLGQLESNNNTKLATVGKPELGIFKANINANTIISHWGMYYANIATVTITNSDHSDLKVGMVANIVNPSTGAFGNNSVIVEKSVSGNITAGNFIPGCTYTISSIGTTDFTAIGAYSASIGEIFIANAVGIGTGTAIGSNNEIILKSNHTITGNVTFTVSPLKLGRYQISQWLLINYGYLDNNGNWTDKDNIDTTDLFLLSDQIQNNIMYQFLKENYVKLIKAGAIKTGDTKDIVAGMLSVAYQYQDLGNPQLGQTVSNSNGVLNIENYSIATKAKVWRETGQTVDSQNRPGHIYFNAGRYAISNLGADIVE